MDSKGKMPHIKSDVNKLDDKKKSAGLLATLFGGGANSAGGLGGLGGGAAAGGGGMLATKAGMIGLIVIGTAVAGSVGMVGLKVFGPGEADQTGGKISLFAPKTKDAPSDPNALAPVSKDGSSASLDYMAQAGAKDNAADAAAAASEQSAAAAQAASAADAGRSGASGAINSGSGSKGSLGSMGKALTKGMSALSKAATSGSGGGSSVSASNPASSVQSGAVSAFKPSAGARASGSTGRGIASRIGGNNAHKDLGMVRGDHRNPGSSMAAGTTYDGGAKGGSAIGPNGTAIGMDGSGSGAEAQPKSISKNSAPNVNEQSPPIPKPVHVVVPWEKAVQRAQMLVMLALGLAFLASKIPAPPWVKMVIGGVISAIGAYIMFLGAQVMSGAYGQPLQGSIVIAAGIGIALVGASTIIGNLGTPTADAAAPAGGAAAAPAGGTAAAPAGGTAAAPAAGGSSWDVFNNVNPAILWGGGIAAVAAIGLFLVPKPKPVEVEDGQRGPDVSYHQIAPPQNYSV